MAKTVGQGEAWSFGGTVLDHVRADQVSPTLSALIRQKEILESPNGWLVRVCALCPPATLAQGVQI